MHDTAHELGRRFFELYWHPQFSRIVELGSQDVNGSLRDHCPDGASYLGIDTAPGPGVDLVLPAGAPLPLDDDSADVVVTSSALEHDMCFWATFTELVRVLRPGGLLYINAPSNHQFHRYPVDCWRFYPDAGLALVEWSRRCGRVVSLVESFVRRPGNAGWADFVAVFHKAGAPLERRGRLSADGETLNAFDLEAPALARASDKTFDMLATERLSQQLTACHQEAGRIATRAAALSIELTRAYEAILALKKENEVLRNALGPNPGNT